MSSTEAHPKLRPPLPVAVAVTVLVLGWVAATIGDLLDELDGLAQAGFSAVVAGALAVGLRRGQRGAWMCTPVVAGLNAVAGLVGWLGLTDRIDDGIAAPLRLAVAVLVVALVTVPSDARAYFRRKPHPAGQAS